MPQLRQQQIQIPPKGSPNPRGFTLPERPLIPWDIGMTQRPRCQRGSTEEGLARKSSQSPAFPCPQTALPAVLLRPLLCPQPTPANAAQSKQVIIY